MELSQWALDHAGNLGFGTLVSIFIYMVYTGKMVPKTTVDDIRTDRDARLAAKERVAQDWKDAYRREQERGVLQDKQIDKLLEQSDITVHLLRSLPRPEEK